ncbi:hypothetical protein ABZ907_13810 [Nonomuraea wenchangensis]
MGGRTVPAKVRALAVVAGALLIIGPLDPSAGRATPDFRLASEQRVATAEPLGKPLKGHTGTVEAVAVGRRSDGSPVIVSGGDDGSLLMWDLDTGERIGEPLAGHTSPISALATGRRSDGTPVVISSGGDRTIRIWSLGARSSTG